MTQPQSPQPVTIETTPDELQALLQLTTRAPLTLAEALFVETLFARWQQQTIAQLTPAGPPSDAPPSADN